MNKSIKNNNICFSPMTKANDTVIELAKHNIMMVILCTTGGR